MKLHNYTRMAESPEVFLNRKKQLKLETATSDNNSIEADYVVLLNENNSKAVEEKIKKDDNYINYILMVSEYIKSKYKNKEFPRNSREDVLALVRIIDFENSTDVWTHCRESIHKIVDFIINPEYEFWSDLEKGKSSLVDRLMEHSIGKTQRMVKNKVTGEKEPKDTTFTPESLCSKVCKYFAEYILNNKDMFYISDKFVKRVAPHYYFYYLGVEKPLPTESYSDLYDYLKEIHIASNKKREV